MRANRRYSRQHSREPSWTAFTLLELLVVMSIMALLVALLLPAFAKVTRGTRKLKCASNMRSVAYEFQLFAGGQSKDGQGDSERLGRNRFYISDFQDSLYALDEFWDRGVEESATINVNGSVMMCPEGPAQLLKRRGFPCGTAALRPPRDISIGVNMRLYRSVVSIGSQRFLAPAQSTTVRSSIMDHPYVPVLLDIDGEEAVRRGLEPFYTAPPGKTPATPYFDGRYWMPSDRHDRRTNVAFVGGHVLSSPSPAEEDWNWEYQGRAGQ